MSPIRKRVSSDESRVRDVGFRAVRPLLLSGTGSPDPAVTLIDLHFDRLDPEAVRQTLGALIKDADDLERFRSEAIEQIIQTIAS